MIKKLKFMMWLTCLSVNVFGFMLVFKAGKTPAVLYAAFVIATLALNRPSFSLHAIETSWPVFVVRWWWRQQSGSNWFHQDDEKPRTFAGTSRPFSDTPTGNEISFANEQPTS